MRHRRVVPLLAAASVAVVAAAGCGATSAAITVDDESMSRSDFEESLDFVYDNAGMRTWVFRGEVPADRLRAEDAPPGVYTQDYVGALSGIYVQFMVAHQIVDDLGLTVTDDDRAAIEDEMDQVVDGGLDAVPQALRDIHVDGEAALALLGDEADADEVDEAVRAITIDGDMSVSSRYGRFDPDQFAVIPPAGPRPAPGGDAADGSDLPAD